MLDPDKVAMELEARYQEALQIGENNLKGYIEHLNDLLEKGDEELFLDPTWDNAYYGAMHQLELIKEGKDKTLEERLTFWKNMFLEQYEREQNEILESDKTRKYNF